MQDFLETNLEIGERLLNYLIDKPHVRFGQALVDLGIIKTALVHHEPKIELKVVDPYYEEPKEILNRVNKGVR